MNQKELELLCDTFTSGELELEMNIEQKTILTLFSLEKIRIHLKEKYGKSYDFSVMQNKKDITKFTIHINKEIFDYPVETLFNFFEKSFKDNKISYIRSLMSARNKEEFKTTLEIIAMTKWKYRQMWRFFISGIYTA